MITCSRRISGTSIIRSPTRVCCLGERSQNPGMLEANPSDHKELRTDVERWAEDVFGHSSSATPWKVRSSSPLWTHCLTDYFGAEGHP